nr:EGF receptor domain containing protein [Haemonchus contortus]
MSADYLEKMVENCNSINGDLLIEGLKNLPPNIGKLAQIEQINGRLIVKKNSGVPDLSFLPNLEEIDTVDSDLPCLEVVGNENFTLKGLTGIRNIYGNVYVSTRRKSDVPAEVKQYLKQITVGTSTFVYDNVTQEGGSHYVLWICIIVFGIVLLIVVLVIGIILIARRSTKLRKLILKKRPKTAEVEAAAAISSKEATVKSSDGASKSIEGSRDI